MRSRFNEAAALKPRKRSARSSNSTSRSESFNEAAALKPRKRCARELALGGQRPGFNEAAALKPRKRSPYGTDHVVVLGASMRPRH